MLSNEQIMGLLPHRFPFALVDRVIDYEPGKTALANLLLREKLE